MSIRIVTLLFLNLFSTHLFTQKALNTTGSFFRTEQLQLATSLGELAIKTHYGTKDFITEGVLQPLAVPSAPLFTVPLGKGLCPADSATVEFSSFYKFETGNEFILQLSDAKGSFASPKVIGKISSVDIRRVPFYLPSNLRVDSSYFIRVVSTKPKLEGSVTNLFVRPKPKADFTIPDVICTGDPITATFTGKDTIATSNLIWDFSGALWEKIGAKGTQGASWSVAGKKTVRLVVDNNGCFSDTVRKTIVVEQRIAKPKLTCGKLSGNSITFNCSQVGGATDYQPIRTESHPDVVENRFSWTYRNLPPNTRITFGVRAIGSGPCALSMDTITCATLICPTFSATLKKPQVYICEGKSAYAELDLRGANVSGEYALVYRTNTNKADTITVQPGENPTFNPIESTTYSILAIGNQSYDGCFTTLASPIGFTVSVTSNDRPGTPKPPFLACDNQDTPIVLNDQLDREDNNGKWESSTNFPLQTFDPVAGTFLPYRVPEGKYSFTYTVPGKNGCGPRSAVVSINIERKLEVAIKDYSNCLDPNGKTIIELNKVARRVNAFAFNRVTWYNDPNLKDTIKTKTIEISATRKIYALVGSGKCASPVVEITLKPGEALPVPKIEGTYVYNVGERIDLRTTSSFPPGSWFIWQTPDTIISGADTYRFPQLLVTKFSEGVYTLQVVGPPDGKPTCESPKVQQEIIVFEENEAPLKISQNVTENKPWTIEGLDQFPNCKIVVINRWGDRVFESTGVYPNNWHGTYNQNKKLPQGTYYYQIDTGDPKYKPVLGSLYIISLKP